MKLRTLIDELESNIIERWEALEVDEALSQDYERFAHQEWRIIYGALAGAHMTRAVEQLKAIGYFTQRMEE